MLLVDDDQAEPRERREHGATACRRRRRRRRGGCAATGRGARRRTGRCAEWRRASPNALRKSAATAGVRAISGHHQQHAAARLAHAARKPEIDLGLAAAGDAVQQRDMIRRACRQTPQPRPAPPPARVVSVTRRRGVGHDERVEGIALDAEPFDGDEPQSDEAGHAPSIQSARREIATGMPSGTPRRRSRTACCRDVSGVPARSSVPCAVTRATRIVRDASAFPRNGCASAISPSCSSETTASFTARERALRVETDVMRRPSARPEHRAGHRAPGASAPRRDP